MGIVTRLFVLLLYGFLGLYLCGQTLMLLWNDFAVQAFPALHPIDFRLAVGLTLLLSWVKYKAPTLEEIDSPSEKAFGYATFKFISLLFSCGLIYLFSIYAKSI